MQFILMNAGPVFNPRIASASYSANTPSETNQFSASSPGKNNKKPTVDTAPAYAVICRERSCHKRWI